jgi:hypothetical protein
MFKVSSLYRAYSKPPVEQVVSDSAAATGISPAATAPAALFLSLQ